MIKHFAKGDDFDAEIKDSLVLVDFFATWCGPCSMLAPVLEQLDKEIDIKIIKIDTDEFIDIARKYRVMSIPALFIFKNGELVNQALGYMPIEHLRKFVAK